MSKYLTNSELKFLLDSEVKDENAQRIMKTAASEIETLRNLVHILSQEIDRLEVRCGLRIE